MRPIRQRTPVLVPPPARWPAEGKQNLDPAAAAPLSKRLVANPVRTPVRSPKERRAAVRRGDPVTTERCPPPSPSPPLTPDRAASAPCGPRDTPTEPEKRQRREKTRMSYHTL